MWSLSGVWRSSRGHSQESTLSLFPLASSFYFRVLPSCCSTQLHANRSFCDLGKHFTLKTAASHGASLRDAPCWLLDPLLPTHWIGVPHLAEIFKCSLCVACLAVSSSPSECLYIQCKYSAATPANTRPSCRVHASYFIQPSGYQSFQAAPLPSLWGEALPLLRPFKEKIHTNRCPRVSDAAPLAEPLLLSSLH